MNRARRAGTPGAQLAGFLARYPPAIARLARRAMATLRSRMPAATVLVGDTYNGLVVGFGPSDRASEAIFSIVLYPRWVTLFFLNGARLKDPEGLLRGEGNRVRHMVLDGAATLARRPRRPRPGTNGR